MKSGKVWGETELVLQTPFIEFHRIWVHQGGFCSLHKHEFKWNMFYVTSGELAIHIHKSDYELIDTTVLGPRQWTTVKPGEYHSLKQYMIQWHLSYIIQSRCQKISLERLWEDNFRNECYIS